MEKIIFLDIDGVLNSVKSAKTYHKKYGGNGYGGFFNKDDTPTLRNVLWDKRCVRFLGKIIEETSAKVVLSSTWRKSFEVPVFQAMFKLYGLTSLDIIGKTPSLENGIRVEEIQQYIDEALVKTYLILDDDCDMIESQKPFFVNTDSTV
jgi:hypothetical protein